MTPPPATVGGFTLLARPAGAAWRWPVYARGTGPTVIVLHEFNGLSHDDLAYGARLAAEGFTVWMPVLAGPAPSTSGCDRLRAHARICVSREITLLRTGRSSRIADPLRALARHAMTVSGAAGVGVVGMCLSGGFALATATDAAVLAAVAAEPALPYARFPCLARDPGVSPTDLVTIRDRLAAGEVEVYLTRFTADKLSPPERHAALNDALGSRGVINDAIPSGAGELFPAGAHAVLSSDPSTFEAAARARLERAAADVAAFLRRRLS